MWSTHAALFIAICAAHDDAGEGGEAGTKLLRTELIPPGRRNLIKQIIYVNEKSWLNFHQALLSRQLK